MVKAAVDKRRKPKVRPVVAADFRHLTRENAAALRLTNDPRLPDWMSSLYALDVRIAAAPLEDGLTLLVALECPGGTMSFAFSSTLFPALALAIDADAAAVPAIGALVASRLLAPLLGVFGQAAAEQGDPHWQAVGVSAVRMLDLATLSPPLMPLGSWEMTNARQLHTHVALISIEPRCTDLLQNMVNRFPARQRPATAAWRISTMLRFATRSWTTAVLSSLEPGDVVLCREAAAIEILDAELFCGAMAGVHQVGRVRVTQQKVTLMSQMQERDGRNGSDDESIAPPLSSGVAELEVPVHFELDSTALSLAQLASLRPGYVIELAIPVPDAEIRLVACGQIIGRGKLVVIGDCIGVQLESIALGNA